VASTGDGASFSPLLTPIPGATGTRSEAALPE